MIWDRFTLETLGGAVMAGAILVGAVLLWIRFWGSSR